MRPLLVTAGATRNPVDAMRYLSAYSSGGTGAWLVEQLAPADLLGSPEAVLRAGQGATFGSTRDLMARMEGWVRAHPGGVVVHAAAVGDYEALPDAGKIPSGQDELVVRLRPTPKIIDHVTTWDPSCRLVGFKAAAPGSSPEQVREVARKQIARTGAQLVFANVIGQLESTCQLVEADRAEGFETRAAALEALAARVRDLRQLVRPATL